MTSNIAIIFLGILCVSFALSYLAIKKQLQEAQILLLDIFQINFALQEKISGEKNNEEDVHKESFIKFLSDSRDWAYQYIETTQNTIKEVAEGLNKKGLSEDANKLLALLPKENDNV